jgi:hypothetical protein
MPITHQQVAEIILVMLYVTGGIITVYSMDRGGWLGVNNGILGVWQTLLRVMILLFWPIVIVFPVGIWYMINSIKHNMRKNK